MDAKSKKPSPVKVAVAVVKLAVFSSVVVVAVAPSVLIALGSYLFLGNRGDCKSPPYPLHGL